MIYRAGDLYEKEVICIKDGTRLGFMSDLEINTENGCVETIIIYGKSRFFGLFGKDEDRIIPWHCIEVFGDEVILVNCEPPRPKYRKSKALLQNFFD